MLEIEIRPVSAKDFFSYPEARRLIKEYSKECANRTLASSPPNEDQYLKLEELGLLKAAGAFNGDTMVGFVVVVFSFVPHFKEETLASTESLFLSKPFRTGNNGLKLLQWARNTAVLFGSAGLFVSAPAGSRLEKLLSHKAEKTNSVFFLEGLCS